MIKKDLAKLLAAAQNTSIKSAEESVQTLFDLIAEALAKNEEVDIHGFGKFEVRERAGRKGINPRTKEEIDIPSKRVVSFSAKKALKDRINETEADSEE